MSKEQALHVIATAVSPPRPLSEDQSIRLILTDSLDYIWGIQEIEKAIGKDLPNGDVAKCQTVGDLADCIVRATCAN
jgi:acyl carrier protein